MLNRYSGASGRIRLEKAVQLQFIVQGDLELASLLCDKAKVLEHNAGETIIVQDTADDSIHLIVSGQATIKVNGRDIAKRAAGTHIGEMALIDPRAMRSASAIALESTVTARISAEDFFNIANNHPVIWQRIALELGNRLRERNKYVKMPNPIPSVFLGSSKESLPIVGAVVSELNKSKGLKLVPWAGDLFWPSDSTIEDLEECLSNVDFAILVFGPDDQITSRKQIKMAPRDNVLFECGMCFGALGRKRTYIIKPLDLDVKIPSDLFGLSFLDYEVKGRSVDVSTACANLKRCVKRYGPR